MRNFDIQPVDLSLRDEIQRKIDNLNKPKGSLGRLESLAMQVCMVQQTLSPSVAKPCHLLLGGDHGIEHEGVSVSPRAVTWQQMINFTRGGGGVNMFCRQHGFDLSIVDVGVDYDLTPYPAIMNRKIARGTQNFLYEPAMTEGEYDRAIAVGIELVDECSEKGCRVLSIGEMGIGNTSPSSIWMHLFTGITLAECIGAGAGLNNEGIRHKYEVLSQAVRKYEAIPHGQTVGHSEPTGTAAKAAIHGQTVGHSELTGTAAKPTIHGQTVGHSGQTGTAAKATIHDAIQYFGGFEMVAAIGAMLRGAEQHLIILVDGFIMTACALAACQLYPAARDYMVFTHCGDESGHKRMLDALGAEPLLHLGLRLGEGTGALCAFPIVDSAVRMMNEMNNFDNAHITRYF